MSRFLEFREENDADFDAVARLHDTAFGGGMESRIVTRIRQGHRPYLSYVALSDSTVCGHALFSEVDVIGARTSAVAVALGPVAVLPARQLQGIGTQLIRHGLKWCREHHYETCFVLGDPAYYCRFGFVRPLYRVSGLAPGATGQHSRYCRSIKGPPTCLGAKFVMRLCSTKKKNQSTEGSRPSPSAG